MHGHNILVLRIAPFLLGSFAAVTAFANGQFPAADHLVVDPGDASHIIVRTTFGVMTSRDAGASFDLLCESGMGYANYLPAVDVTADGSLIAGYVQGLGIAHGDSCGWGLSGAPLDGQFVTDVSTFRATPEKAIAVTALGGANISRVWVAPDNGTTWSQLGVDLPTGFLAKTLDVATSDPARIYVSGSDGSTGSIVGRVARSLDSGETWELFDIPGSDSGSSPFIAAIDPTDEDTLYVRLDGVPGHLLVSTDAAETWTEIFTGLGFLKGFALAPDGSSVLVGGPVEGVWRAPAKSAGFVKVSDVGVRCLKWEAAGVYACADNDTDGFTLGISADQGSTFAPLFHLPCLRGPLACPASTSIGALCPGEWPALADQLAIDCSGEGGSSGTTSTATETATSTSGAGGDSATGTSGAGGGGDGYDGCSCSLPIPASRGAGGALLVLGGLLAVRSHRRHHRRKSCEHRFSARQECDKAACRSSRSKTRLHDVKKGPA